MATRDETLKFIVETAGEADLLKLADAMEQLEVDGAKAESAAGRLVEQLADLEKAGRAAAKGACTPGAHDTI